MNFVLSAMAYLFISGVIAGLAIHDTAKNCGAVSRQTRNEIMLSSLAWPMIFGVVATISNGDIENTECTTR